MIDPWATLGIWLSQRSLLVMMILLCTPGAMDHAILTCQIALHECAPGFIVGVVSFSCHG